ncbi:MAG: GNAT family N-acetyltransferase, partial [Hyphomicrobiaceae bacterium]
ALMSLIVPITDSSARSALCAEIAAELPLWFGRPEANAWYIREIAAREAFAGVVEGRPRALMALEYHFTTTCNIWWLGVSPTVHRRGLGRALIERAALEAQTRNCRYLAVQTMSPRANSSAYELTRRFYEAVGFVPFVEYEPEPGDYMMWMLRELRS